MVKPGHKPLCKEMHTGVSPLPCASLTGVSRCPLALSAQLQHQRWSRVPAPSPALREASPLLTASSHLGESGSQNCTAPARCISLFVAVSTLSCFHEL